MTIEVDDIVLCTVEKIEGTVVFVRLESGEEGSIVVSEIAPGRIRNLRDYVSPNKKIVCKVLRISPNGNVELSLRRVTQKDQKEVTERYQQEKSCISVLKSVIGKEGEKVAENICKQENILEYFNKAKNDSKELEKLVGKENAKKIVDIINSQKKKSYSVKKEINLNSKKSNGITLIKEILNLKNIEVSYISAGKYLLKIESSDAKKAENDIKEAIKLIEEESKKKGLEFSIKI